MGASLVTVHAGQRARVGGTRRAWEPSSQSSRARGQSRHVQTQGPPHSTRGGQVPRAGPSPVRPSACRGACRMTDPLSESQGPHTREQV